MCSSLLPVCRYDITAGCANTCAKALRIDDRLGPMHTKLDLGPLVTSAVLSDDRRRTWNTKGRFLPSGKWSLGYYAVRCIYHHAPPVGPLEPRMGCGCEGLIQWVRPGVEDAWAQHKRVPYSQDCDQFHDLHGHHFFAANIRAGSSKTRAVRRGGDICMCRTCTHLQ